MSAPSLGADLELLRVRLEQQEKQIKAATKTLRKLKTHTSRMRKAFEDIEDFLEESSALAVKQNCSSRGCHRMRGILSNTISSISKIIGESRK